LIVVMMGVSGSGKTRIGRLLAESLGWTFVDADDLHPPENIARMTAGTALDDSDREPWLQAIRAELLRLQAEGEDVVLACSALRAAFRRRLTEELRDVRFVHLSGSRELILDRLNSRRGHFMPAELLGSQFEALEIPSDSITVDAGLHPEAIVGTIREALFRMP
jgi:gluconokinase